MVLMNNVTSFRMGTNSNTCSTHPVTLMTETQPVSEMLVFDSTLVQLTTLEYFVTYEIITVVFLSIKTGANCSNV
jgi:hypothetical protein